MQPSLALAYVPGAGNGIVGMGWQLTGLATISRVNYGNGINFEGGDTYTHSQLGVLLVQLDGSYRTKKETFTKLVPSGTCGDGPCSWAASDRSGMTYFFGTTNDSRLLKQGSLSVRRWELAKVVDLFGNSYEVTYINDSSSGTTYPSVITYTKGPGLTTFRTVEFAYEPRGDVEAGFFESDFQQINSRLKWISISSSGTLIRKYRLDYGETGAVTGRSHLTAFQEYGSDGVSTLPAQTFGWQQGAQGLALQRWATQQGAWFGGDDWAKHALFLQGDFDGDGKTDIAYVFNEGGGISMDAHLATGSSFNIQRWATHQGDWQGGDDWPKKAAFLTGDFDGDGKTDIAYVFNDGGQLSIDVHRSTGGSFDLQRWASLQGDWLGGDDWANSATFLTGDFNGDGKTDIAYLFNDGGQISIDVHLSNGSSFDLQRWATHQGDWVGGADWQKKATFLPSDFDGDGRADLAYIFNDGGQITIDVHRSTGGSFTLQRWATQQGDWIGGDDWFKKAMFLPSDFNGDGKVDLAYAFNDGGQLSIDVHLATGSSFLLQRWATQQGDWIGGDNWFKSAVFLPSDFNGDGKADIAYVFNDGGGISIDVHSATGSSFVLQRWATQQGSWLRGDDWQKEATFLTGDFDGSGKAAIAYVFNDGGSQSYDVHSAAAPSPDLLTTVNNGLGGTVVATYASAPQVPNAIVPTSAAPGIPNAAPQQLTTQITTSDGRGGSFSTRFNYFDARLLPGTVPDQRNLGFAYVDTVDAQTGQYTRTLYNQSPAFEGRVSQEDTVGGNGLLLGIVAHQYELVFPNAGTELARETRKVATAYEFGTPGFSQTATSGYDGCGNVNTTINDADNLPTVRVTSTFSCDTRAWILDRILEVKTDQVAAGATTILNWMRNTWANNVLTQKSEWLDSASAWVTTTMAFDANGNLVSVTDPATADGLVRTSTREYESSFRVYPKKLTDALGHSTQTTYNADGLVTSVTDANGQVISTTYDVFGRKATETRPDGGTTSYAYLSYGDPNAQANTTQTVVGSQVLQSTEQFDGTGFKYRTSTSGDSGATICVDSRKDSAGRAGAASTPYFCGQAAVFATSAYDAAGRVATVTAPDGTATFYSYATDHMSIIDPSGGVTTSYRDARGRTTAVVDAAGQITRYAYDALGRLASVTLPDASVTATVNDSLGRKISVTDPRLGTSIYAYDVLGNVLSVTSGGKTISFTYDALNRVTHKKPGSEAAVTYVYDEAAAANASGRLTTLTDTGGKTRFAYTSTGQLGGYIKTIDGVNYSQHFTYDTAGRLTRVTYPDASYADYAYAGGRNLSSVSLNGAVYATWSGYNASGKPQNVAFGNGVATQYNYDVVNRMLSMRTAKGPSTFQDLTYTFAPGGMDIGSITDNRANKIARDGSNTDETQAYAYDALHRLTGAVGVWGSKKYAYDAMGNVTNFGGLTNRALAYSGQQVTSGTGLSQVTYDSAGNMTRKVLDGVAYKYKWTAENRLASVLKTRPDDDDDRLEGELDLPLPDALGVSESIAGEFNALGCRGDRPENESFAQNRATKTLMTYDADGQRVKKVFVYSPARAVVTTYINRMYEKRTYPDHTQRHTINLFANDQLIATVTRTGCIATAMTLPKHMQEIYLASMFSSRSFIGLVNKTSHLLVALAFHPRTPLVLYSLLALGFAFVFAACLGTRMAKATRRGIGAYRYVGRRLATVVTAFALTVTACSGPHDTGSSSQPLLRGDTTRGPGVGTYFFHVNHINSSSVVTDATGKEAMRYVYLPFGEIARGNSTGQDRVTAKFTGQEQDEETGLYYYRARYYDPAIGRFLSADNAIYNIANAQSWNRYSYVNNNPIMYVDPTGHFLDFLGDIWHAITAAVSWIGNAIVSAAKWVANAIVSAAKWIYDFFSSKVGRLVLAGIIVLATLVADVFTGGALTSVLIGEIAGGLSALLQGGNVLAGVAVGGLLGGVASLAAGGIAAGVGSWAAQIGKGALQGAIYGAAFGAASGFAGGKGTLKSILLSSLEGAAIGAVLGAARPLLLGREITSEGPIQDALKSAQERVLEQRGVVVDITKVAVREGGLWQLLYEQNNAAAMTIANTMNISDTMFITHELVHVLQWQTMGMGYLTDYLWQLIKVGYDNISYEKEAYQIGG